jgi:protein phosphatase
VRHANEDSLRFNADAGSFILCDGMGGAQGGATASRLAAESALAVLTGADPGSEALLEAVQSANRTVYSEAQRRRDLEGMGTTLVALSFHEGTASVAHVGDSRCYVLREGNLQRLTRDHSFVEEQMRIGRMTREQARRSPMQNVITRAIGTRAEVLPEVSELPLQSGDIFLLASDGLTRELEDAAIQKVLREQTDLSIACTRLIQLANKAGGRDNISCILVHVYRNDDHADKRVTG